MSSNPRQQAVDALKKFNEESELRQVMYSSIYVLMTLSVEQRLALKEEVERFVELKKSGRYFRGGGGTILGSIKGEKVNPDLCKKYLLGKTEATLGSVWAPYWETVRQEFDWSIFRKGVLCLFRHVGWEWPDNEELEFQKSASKGEKSSRTILQRNALEGEVKKYPANSDEEEPRRVSSVRPSARRRAVKLTRPSPP